MNKSMSGRLFLSFILLVTAIFAVLELVIGQLFPFYLEGLCRSANRNRSAKCGGAYSAGKY